MRSDFNPGRRGALAMFATGALGAATGWHMGSARASADGGRPGGRLIGDWSLTAYQTIRAADGYADPLAASRALAMMHVAMHDAVNSARPRFRSYAMITRQAAADPEIAAAAAAHDVLRALYPAQAGALADELAKLLAEAGRGPEIERGRAAGAAAALAILADRAGDGAERRAAYAPGEGPGRYRFTPGFDFAFAPHWRHVRPFVLGSPAEFRVPAPPALDSAEYRAAFEEVKALGDLRSRTRSTDQTRYAHFWYEFSDIGWNRVARVVAAERGLNLWAAARLFALLNMAMADAYIAGWDSKLHHDFWRPVTAIRAGGEPGWEPLLPTPPIQDHPSTHSALGAAAAAVLAGLVGDATGFAMTSTTALPENPLRRFPGFSDAARENAESRIMAGLHFRFACEAGLDLGDRIGRQALARYLRPTA